MRSERARKFQTIAMSAALVMGPSASSQEQSSVVPETPSVSQSAVQSEQSFLGLPLEASSVQRGVAAVVVAPGIQDKTVISGLTYPTALRFASDGSLFVAEKRGTIKRFKNIADTAPVTVVDLGPRVMNLWDRGLLGLETDPRNPNILYASYTVDAPVGQTPPVYNDNCAGLSCAVDGEVDRLTLDPATKKVTKRDMLLKNTMPQQFSSHSVGFIRMGPDNNLYVSAGEGASFTKVDYGQDPSVPPMGDAPRQGGALRSQTMRTFDGGVTRVNPRTLEAMIVSKGMRNPFRGAFRPGTKELWSGDVGWYTWEEINRDPDVTNQDIKNFGWPCYEGVGRQPLYAAANLSLCNDLYARGPSALGNVYDQYNHNGASAALSALGFTVGTAFPPEYRGLWYGDYGKQQVSMLPTGPNGLPDPKLRRTILTGVTPSDLQVGPNGKFYYPDIRGGQIHEISAPANRDPQAVIKTDKIFGSLPTTVTMNGNESKDPDVGDQATLTYEWDTDGNGTYDATGKVLTRTYTQAKNVQVSLRVKDGKGGIGTVREMLYPGDTPPVPKILAPANGKKYLPGQTVQFNGNATDLEEGQIPGTRIKWKRTIYHCPKPTDCHPHELSESTGLGGSFTFPEHGSPAEYKVGLTQTATDNRGMATSSTVFLFKQ